MHDFKRPQENRAAHDFRAQGVSGSRFRLASSRLRAGTFRRLGIGAGVIFALLFALQPLPAAAQDYGGASPLGSNLPTNLNSTEVQQILQNSQSPQVQQQNTQNQNALGPNQSVQAPDQQVASGGQVQVPPSAIEQSFSARAGVALNQFGYSAFGQGRPVVVGQAGAIADSYVLGVNDEVVINIRGGAHEGTYRIRVDREGRVIMPGLPPVTAAGRTFGDFRNDFTAIVTKSFVGTDVYLSLGDVRQLSVLVLGEVGSPGLIQISALSTVVDALLMAGGVKRSGSLRDIHIYRGDKDLPVDLYALLTRQGTKITMSIQEGDRILVNPSGNMVAVAGQVRRPGIFELAPGQHGISGKDLLELAGGLPRGAYRYTLQEILRDGRESLVPLATPDTKTIAGGEILFVRPLRNVVAGKVQLLGDVRLPGEYPLSRYGSLRALVGRSEVLGAGPYLPYAVQETTDPRTLARTFRSFDLSRVLVGSQDAQLKDGDRIFIFGTDDIGFLSSQTILNALRGVMPGEAPVAGAPSGPASVGTPGAGQLAGAGPAGGQGALPTSGAIGQSCTGAALLALRVRNSPNGELATGQLAEAARNLAGLRQDCPNLFDQVPELLTFVVSQSVFVAGDARRPGIYPIADPSRTLDVLAVAGAGGQSRVGAPEPVRRYSTSGREILETREARVTLAGAIKFPGSRSLRSAGTLRDLIGDRTLYTERPYLLFGIIARQNEETLARRILPFSPIRIIEGQANLDLQDRDLVLLFSQDDMRDLVARVVAERQQRLKASPLQPILGQRAPTAGSAATQTLQASPTSIAAIPQDQQSLLQQTGTANAPAQTGQSAQVMQQVSNLSPAASPWEADQAGRSAGAEGKASSMPLEYDVLAPILIDHLATITGSVNQPGDYPVMPQTPLGQLLSVAGGLRAEADLSAVEVTTTIPLVREARTVTERNMFDLRNGNPDRVLVAPGNVVLVRQLTGNRENGAVALLGEVVHPGQYDLLRNETLVSVLRRAGGLTEVAYPYGAVFTRVSAALAERDALTRTANQIEQGLSTVALTPSASKEQQVQPANLDFLRTTLDQLRNAPVLGRVSVETNPAMLAVHPELDTLMQGGDAVYYPKRPSTVLVSGEVLNQGSQQFISGRTASAYLRAAGGMTQDADSGRAFLLLPNGTAQPLHLSSWDFRSDKIPPGAAIIVPRDLRPFSAWTFATNLTQVLSQVGITAASLAVIGGR